MRIELTDVLPLGLLTAEDRPNVVICISADSLEAETSASIREVGYNTVCAAVFEVYDCSTKRFVLPVLDYPGEATLRLLRVEAGQAGDEE